MTGNHSLAQSDSPTSGPPRIARLTLYPVKSFPALPVESLRMLASGAAANDRRWALFDERGKCINGKRSPLMHRLRARVDLNGETISLGFDGDAELQSFSLRSDLLAIQTWLGQVFRIPCQLQENTETGFPDDTDSPGPTIVSTATLNAVAEWFPELTVDEIRRRIRCNIEVENVPAFWEDRLYGPAGKPVPFRIGAVSLLGINPCQRCVVVSRDSLTGDVPRPDFAAEFSEHRRRTLPDWADASVFNHFYRLTVNTRPGSEPTAGQTIQIGDEVIVG